MNAKRIDIRTAAIDAADQHLHALMPLPLARTGQSAQKPLRLRRIPACKDTKNLALSRLRKAPQLFRKAEAAFVRLLIGV